MRILLVESDERLASFLVSGLQRNGYEVDHVREGAAAIRNRRHADLIFLDLGTPHIHGLEICRTLRLVEDVPIIAATQECAERVRVSALRAGSDDCIDKPFGFRELLARIEAVMRRTNPRSFKPRLSYPPLYIDSNLRDVSVAGTNIDLTEKEFDLLWCLASRPGTVISREEIMARVWGDTWNRRSRTIDTHVSSLRGKLGQRSWIATVRGVGFQFCHM